jgi:hypothetical protein
VSNTPRKPWLARLADYCAQNRTAERVTPKQARRLRHKAKSRILGAA